LHSFFRCLCLQNAMVFLCIPAPPLRNGLRLAVSSFFRI
jgi:hypothetical protein